VVVTAGAWASPAVRGAAVVAACYFAAFAAVYPDADVAHRLVLAPGLLLIAAAAQQTDGDDRRARWYRRLLAVALALSAAQIARSLWLYMSA
jgi:ABC-type Na+ efflux pump permease subunit